MKISPLLRVSISFMLIFTGFMGSQQFITNYFSSLGKINLGYYSLLILYSTFIITSPIAAQFINSFGYKIAMILGGFVYTIFLISLITKSSFIILSTSTLLGIAAAFLWNGNSGYILRISDKRHIGSNSGMFNTFLSMGQVLGIVLAGIAVTKSTYENAFFIAALISFLGVISLFTLPNIKPEIKSSQLLMIRKYLVNKLALKLSLIWFSFNLVYGLTIGLIPIMIAETLGIKYVSLTSIFFLMPILFSYISGKLSDIKGRGKLLTLAYFLGIIGLSAFFLYTNSFLLVIGIVFMSLTYAMVFPISLGLIGDTTTSNNLEAITASFWIAQNVGVVFALLISSLLPINWIFLFSICIFIISFWIIKPIIFMKPASLKLKISKAMS